MKKKPVVRYKKSYINSWCIKPYDRPRYFALIGIVVEDEGEYCSVRFKDHVPGEVFTKKKFLEFL